MGIAKAAARTVPSFRDLAEAYLQKHVAAKRKPRTLQGYGTLLRLHILPALGAMRVTDIRRAHITEPSLNLESADDFTLFMRVCRTTHALVKCA